MNELLVKFIEQALKNGEIPAQIRKTLVLRGTSSEEIDKAFDIINEKKGKDVAQEPKDETQEPLEVTPQAVPTPPVSVFPAPTPDAPKIEVDGSQVQVESAGREVPVGSGIKEDWGGDDEIQKPEASSVVRVPSVKQPQTQVLPKVLPQASQGGGPSGRLSYVEPKKSKKGLLLLFLVIFVPLLVASAGGYYYYFYIMQNPDKVINRMIEEMQNVSTYHQKLDMSISFDTSADMTEEGISKLKSKSNSLVSSVILSQLDEKCVAEDGTKIDCETPEELDTDLLISVTLEGDSDVVDKANPKSSYVFAMSLPFLESQLNFEIITIGSTQYYRIKNIPSDVNSFLPVDLSAIENKWIKLDVKSLLEQEKLFGIGADPEMLSEIEKIKEEFSSEKITDKVAELQVLLSNSDMIEVTEDFGTEEIEGDISAHHYGFKVGEENIKQFIKSAFAIIYGGIMEDVMTVEELTESLGEIKLEGEMWIGKKDYLLYKADVKMSTTVKDETFSMTTNYDVLLTMSDFNAPVNIEAPVDYVDFEELITEIFSAVESVALSGDALSIETIGYLEQSLGKYYSIHKSYPDVKNVTDLANTLASSDVISPKNELKLIQYDEEDKNSFYCYRKEGQHYVLGTTLDSQNSSLETDLDGVYLCGATTKDCADPVYCIGPE